MSILRRQSSFFSQALNKWLCDQGSFMKRLKQNGIHDAKVTVLSQGWQRPLFSERAILKMSDHQVALVREVLIKSKQAAWMYARTVFPHEALTGASRRFMFLKNRALGTILFKHPVWQRSSFELLQLTKDSTEYKKISQLTPLQNQAIYARQSVFKQKDKKILLSEVFLPDLIKKIECI